MTPSLGGEFLVNVSVVVSTYSEDKLRYVRDCVESLRRQSVPPFEIILVLDPRPDLVEFYQSRALFFYSLLSFISPLLFISGRNGYYWTKGILLGYVDAIKGDRSGSWPASYS